MNAFAAGAPLVRVVVQDMSGNTVQGATTSITVVIGTNPSGGTLLGTTTVSAVNGVATFRDLSIDKAGTGYTLTASATGLTGATSTAFDIVAFTSVSVGGESACGLTTKGAAYCWGENSAGELGNGTPSDFIAHPAPTAVSGGLTFTAVSTSDRFACAITATGTGYCWGFNGQGNLGADTSPGEKCVVQDLRTGQPAWCSTVPHAVTGGLSFSAISAGGMGAAVHPGNAAACGVSANGAAHCWGGNGSGQLGDSSFTDSSLPVAVAGGLTFTTISVGRDHTCGLTTSGPAYCWGSDCEGQLGDGRIGGGCSGPPLSNVPVPVSGGLSFGSVSASVWNWFTCGVTTSGAAYCWGGGVLGDGSTSISSVPVAVAGGMTFTMVSTGSFHTCAVTASGSAYCWGESFDGQIGNGTFATATTPVPVSGGLTFVMVSAGGNSTCGVTIAGAAYCWGNNVVGELGNGTTTNSNVPVKVVGVP